MVQNRGFRGLIAWQVGMDIVTETYRLTALFPDQERYGLISQMRRASVSLPSNIAEGQPVTAPRWNLRFVSTALGSACELDTQLEAAIRLGFCSGIQATHLQQLIDRIQKLLYGMRREKERRLMAGVGVCLAAAILVRTFV